MTLRLLLVLLALPYVARAQAPIPPALPSPAQSPPAQARSFEPTLYCLYDGMPYSRGSRLYQAGLAMACDSVAANPASLVWQLAR